MSAANTGQPAAETCSAMSWRVRVLPVPVAPAISPWRLRKPSGIPTSTVVSGGSAPGAAIRPAEADAWALEAVARGHVAPGTPPSRVQDDLTPPAPARRPLPRGGTLVERRHVHAAQATSPARGGLGHRG